MNKNTAQPNSNYPSGSKSQKANNKQHDADMKRAADNKMKAEEARQGSADKKAEEKSGQKM